MAICKTRRILTIVTVMVAAIAAGLAADASSYEIKSNSENRVRVDVRPVQLTPGRTIKFEVRMNTHSADLGQTTKAMNLRRRPGRGHRPAVIIAREYWNFKTWRIIPNRSHLLFGKSIMYQKEFLIGGSKNE